MTKIKLSQKNARMIVDDLNRIIDENVNIMDRNGVILASTDEKRIGKLHAGARKIIEENLDELIIIKSDEYIGSKEGTNYPLIVNGEVVGVIGITGADEKCQVVAKCVKKMTEMMLSELIQKEEKTLEENIRNRFLEEWINDENMVITGNFIKRGKELGIDITLPRRFAALSVFSDHNDVDAAILKNIDNADNYLKRLILYDKNNIMLHMTSYMIVGVLQQSDEEIEAYYRNIKMYVENKYKVKIAIGIDESESDSALSVHSSVMKARRALQLGLRKKSADICFYSNLNLEILAEEISDTLKMEFIRKIFRGMDDTEMKEAVQLLETYYNMNGSVNKTARSLYLHKNTIQNRLKKISEHTYYDPRDYNNAALFYLAIYFYHETVTDL